jgi:hypothetical protein
LFVVLLNGFRSIVLKSSWLYLLTIYLSFIKEWHEVAAKPQKQRDRRTATLLLSQCDEPGKMSPGELDILEHHLLSQSQAQLSGQSPAYSDTDNSLLKKYIIASPEGEEATSRAISESLKTGSGSSSSQAESWNNANASNAGTSLEAALAALGDAGRQQLLAILQLANGGSNGGSGSGGAQGMTNMSTHSRHPSSGLAGSPEASAGQTAKPSVELGKQKSSLKSSQRHHSSNHSTHSSPKGSSGQPSPTYFANAFHQYAGVETARQGSNSSRGAPNGNASTNVTSFPARTGSAVSSAHPSPASVPVAGPSTIGTSTISWNGQPSKSKSDVDMHHSFDGSDFAARYLPADAAQYRSPAPVPGTSSSAFYSENGAGDDTDVRKS